MTKVEKNFLFTWSTKHTRLGFQSFIASILFFCFANFKVQSISLFGMINFEGMKDDVISYILIVSLVFAIYSIAGLLFRSLYEAPDRPTYAYRLAKVYRKSIRKFFEVYEKLKSIEKADYIESAFWDSTANWEVESPETNRGVAKLAQQIYTILYEWENVCFSSPLVIFEHNETPAKMPEKFFDFTICTTSKMRQVTRPIEDKIEILVNDRREHWQGGDNFLESLEYVDEIIVNNIHHSDFKSLKKLAFAQFRNSIRLYFKVLYALFYRFVDVYLLPVILPLFTSTAIIIFSLVDKKVFS